MAHITIEVPESLIGRLDEVKERLSEELARWPDHSPPPFTEVYRYVLEFLASTPSPEAILNFKMTAAMQERISDLLEKNRSDQLTPAESAELDEYVRIDNLVSLLKTRTFRALKAVR
jgi:hypothetical protein